MLELLLAVFVVLACLATYLFKKKQIANNNQKLEVGAVLTPKKHVKKPKNVASVFNARDQLFESLKNKNLEQDEDARLPVPNKAVKKWPVLDLGIHPEMNVSEWVLEVNNGNDTTTYLLQDLVKELGTSEFVSDLHCVTTWSVLDMKWKGVPFKRFMEYVNPDPDWKYLLQYGADGYSVNVTRADVEENLDNMIIALECNGKPISRDHGYVRLIIPGLFGWKGAKYLVGFVFSKHDSPGIWEQRGSHERGRIKFNERWAIIPENEASQEEINARFEKYDGDTLDLKGLGLKAIPDRVFEEFSSMRGLFLDFNQLENIDEYPWHTLHNLERLGLNGNKLKHLPAALGDLSELSELFVIKNGLESLPVELSKCKNLGSLWLDDNFIRDLPVELHKCKGMLVISALNNRIEKLHPEFSGFKHLRCFLIRGNPVTDIPTEYHMLPRIDYLGVDSIDGIDQEVVDQGTQAVLEALKKKHYNVQ
jgi:DMSO/TMAO reductase YedYZ molybdopterin-dependent catalytic subunit